MNQCVRLARPACVGNPDSLRSGRAVSLPGPGQTDFGHRGGFLLARATCGFLIASALRAVVQRARSGARGCELVRSVTIYALDAAPNTNDLTCDSPYPFQGTMMGGPNCSPLKAGRRQRLRTPGVVACSACIGIANAHPPAPPRNRSSMLRSAYPPGGDPPISLRPPKALVVVDSRQSGPPSDCDEPQTTHSPSAPFLHLGNWRRSRWLAQSMMLLA